MYNLSALTRRLVALMSSTAALSSTAVAVGDYKYSAQPADFSGWLLCDGRALPKAGFPRLYQVLGGAFGETPTTFRLPDFRGRVPGAAGAGAGLTARALGALVGAEEHALTEAEMPAHVHAGTTDAATVALNNATSVVRATGGGDNIDVAGAGGISGGNAVSDVTAAAHAHTFTSGSTGGGAAHSLMQPTAFAGNMFVFAGLADTGAAM